MNNYPSKNLMIVSIIIIALLTGIRQTMKHSNKMFQLQFDWKNKEVIYEKNHLKIDSLSYNYISLLGLEKSYQPNNQNTYSISLTNGKVYYFRFLNYDLIENKVEFKGVEWLTGIPDFINQEVRLEEMIVPLFKNNGYTVVTIGDDFLVRDEAKYYRRKIASEIDVNFIGRYTDVFNLKHEASFQGDLDFIYNEIPNIDTAQIYIISVGIDKKELNQQELKTKLNSILDELGSRKSTQKIIWINTPFLKDKSKNTLNHEFNQALMTLNNEKLQILDAYMLFENEKTNYLMPDSIRLNKFGYELLAKKTIELLQ